MGTQWATCPPTASRAIAIPFQVAAENKTEGRPAGIHRTGDKDFLWVWAQYVDTLHEDRVSRVNAVEIARDSVGVLHICTRVDLVTPTEVDDEPRSYGLGVRLTAKEALPEGPTRVTVNWIAGCPCSPLPRGNVSTTFD